MTSKTKTKYARKAPKAPRLVAFEPSLFEGEFRLPSMDTMPLGTVADLNEGDISALFEWLVENGAAEAAVDAIRTLDREEFRAFRAEWGAASAVDPTESTAS